MISALPSPGRSVAGVGNTPAGGGASESPTGSAITFSASNPRFLFYEDGSPCYLAGSGGPEGFLHLGTQQGDGSRSGGDQQAILDVLAAAGVNSLYMIVDATGDSGTDAHPWINRADPGGSTKWHAALITQWHGWLTQLEAAGITAFILLYDDSVDAFGSHSAAEQAFLDDFVAEFKVYDRLVWVVAEEYSEALTTSRVSSIASRIRAADAVHPVAVHQLIGTSFDFSADSDIHQFAMQSGDNSASALHSSCLTAWSNAAGAYNVHMAELNNTLGHGNHTTAEQRRFNWAAAMAGAYVSVYRWWEPDAPTTTELNQLGYLGAFMEATRFDLCEPDDSRAAGDTAWVLAHRDGNDHLIGYGTAVSTGLGFTSMDAATYDLTWMDTESGDEVTEQQTVAGAGSHTFSKPAGITGSEVVLYARKA